MAFILYKFKSETSYYEAQKINKSKWIDLKKNKTESMCSKLITQWTKKAIWLSCADWYFEMKITCVTSMRDHLKIIQFYPYCSRYSICNNNKSSFLLCISFSSTYCFLQRILTLYLIQSLLSSLSGRRSCIYENLWCSVCNQNCRLWLTFPVWPSCVCIWFCSV